MDTRSRTRAGGPFLIHRKGTKVVGLNCNPVEPGLLLSCGNDHFVSSSNQCIYIDMFMSNVDEIALPSYVPQTTCSRFCILKYFETLLLYFMMFRLGSGISVAWRLDLLLIIFVMVVLSTLHTFHQELEAKS